MRPGPALWLALLALFALLCTLAAAFDRFPADVWLARRLQHIDATAFARTLDWTEDLAATPAWIAVWLVAAALLAVTARRIEAVLLLASALGRAFNSGLKEVIDRPRPSPELIGVHEDASGNAFPSGHAEGTLVLYGLLFYFVTVFVRRRALRLAGQATCLWIVVVTGLERVHVGAHWPSDVIGGYYLGALVLAAVIALDRRLARPQRQ
jgi:membrane-associated phospholipid phosphatase